MNTLYVVEAESGVHCGNCELGVGLTRAAAIRDAYGPGGKLPRHAWVNILPRKGAEKVRAPKGPEWPLVSSEKYP